MHNGNGGNAMPVLDWSQCPAVESVPDRLSGAWVFRDTRMPVATVFENLEDMSIDQVMEQFDVTREQINSVLQFVAESLRTPMIEHRAPMAADNLVELFAPLRGLNLDFERE
jgi:uncharacterized protein (DUF433 family)